MKSLVTELNNAMCSRLETMYNYKQKKGELGNEDIGISTVDWRYCGVKKQNSDGYKMVCSTIIKQPLILL